MYDFLNNFHKRMEKLSYSFLIDNKVSMLTSASKYFSSLELINLVYSLMCYVLDRSLRDEECLLQNMSAFMEELSSAYYDRVLGSEEAYDLTHFIVYKILRNDGKPFVFNTIDYATAEKVSFEFHLLQQRTSKQDNNKSTFSLTQEGYRLILGALEVDERTQIDLNQMILELSLKKKNFSQGLMAVENLNNLITAQIHVVNQFIFKTRENIFSTQQSDFEDNFLKNIEVLKEQNKKFDELKEIILVEEERLTRSDSVGSLEMDNYESLMQLGRIKELLMSISYKAGELVSRHFQFKDEYKKALEEASVYYNNKRISIKDDIIKPVEKDASKLPELFRLFNPLFKAEPRKHFNINYMFNEQKLYFKEEDETGVLIEEAEVEDMEVMERRRSKEQYKGVVSTLLAYLERNRETDLKSMMAHFEGKSVSEYQRLVPTVRCFAEVMIELLRIGTIDITEMKREQEDAYENEEIEFDLRKLLVDEINETYRFVKIELVHFYKSGDEKISVQEKHEDAAEFETVEALHCPNISMKME
jgi:hypothetical protein